MPACEKTPAVTVAPDSRLDCRNVVVKDIDADKHTVAERFLIASSIRGEVFLANAKASTSSRF